MDKGTPGFPAPADLTSHFGLAPPPRFILPAILLLLAESPGYGYALVPQLQDFHFGHVDRPAVYRALAQLEGDGLVEAASPSPKGGQARKVYRATPVGERVLGRWMRVVKEEHYSLGEVLRRYRATGSADAVLAEVDGAWTAAIGFGWSPVSPAEHHRRRRLGAVTSAPSADLLESDDKPTSPSGRPRRQQMPRSDLRPSVARHVAADHPSPVEVDRTCGAVGGAPSSRPETPPERQRFRIVPDRSVVLIEVRSTVGPLSFGAVGVRGTASVAIVEGLPDPRSPWTAHVEIDVTGLRSGSRVYDAELLRRIDARRYPVATVDLGECTSSGIANLYRLGGELTFHGVTRPAQGSVSVDASADRLVVTGEHAFDIRDFALPSPTVLMVRMYPDVRVRLHAEAELEVVR